MPAVTIIYTPNWRDRLFPLTAAALNEKSALDSRLFLVTASGRVTVVPPKTSSRGKFEYADSGTPLLDKLATGCANDGTGEENVRNG